MNEKRVLKLSGGDYGGGPVVYWMSRDQRARHNHALDFGLSLSRESGAPFAVVFCLVPDFLGAAARHYEFMLGGLQKLDAELSALDIPFRLLRGEPGEEIPGFASENRVGAVVCDFDPLRVKRAWKEDVAAKLEVPLFEVDAHNVVPCRLASPKQEYAARTFRPKIHGALDEYLEDIDESAGPETPAAGWDPEGGPPDWEEAREWLDLNDSVPPVIWLEPGTDEALARLEDFLEGTLSGYENGSNDPNSGARSDLSPYLHFGHISAQYVLRRVIHSDAPGESREAFIEELLVRRELSDNFCYYNPDYDGFAGFPDWAKKTLDEHRGDPREYLYEAGQLEKGETHDDLWNAAQVEMITTGKMHGYMRMYWAKKILEWTASPEDALATVIGLNDRYELDGRDPNGYAGAAWSIGGVHDRAWQERDIFGKIRYMSYAGCRRKFDVDAYIKRVREDAREDT